MQTIVVNRHKSYFQTYIGRGTPFGNPFSHKTNTQAKWVVKTRKEAIQLYREWLRSELTFNLSFRRLFFRLKGQVLGCSCKPKSCHGDVIVEFLEFGFIPATKPFVYK